MGPMIRGARVSAGMALAVTLAALPAFAQSEDAVRPEVKKLVIRGVKSVDEDELRRSISTEASHCK